MACLEPLYNPYWRIIRLQRQSAPIVYDFFGIDAPKSYTTSSFPLSSVDKRLNRDELDKNVFLRLPSAKTKEVHWVNDRIYMDDSIQVIKQKITSVIAEQEGSSITNPDSIEIWVGTSPGTVWTPGDKKNVSALRLGDRYIDYEFEVSLNEKSPSNQDPNFFNKQEARPILKRKFSDESSRLLSDFLQELSHASNPQPWTPILFIHLLQDEVAYFQQSKIAITDGYTYSYFQKYWPKSKMESAPSSETQVKKWQKRSRFEVANYTFLNSLQVSSLINPECRLEKVKILLNESFTKPTVDLLKLFHSIDLNQVTVFKRYREPEWISPQFILDKNATFDKGEVTPRQLKDWLSIRSTSDTKLRESVISPYVLTVKRLMFKENDKVGRYATIHIQTSGTVELDFEFQRYEGGGIPVPVFWEIWEETLKWLRMVQMKAYRTSTIIPLPKSQWDEKQEQIRWASTRQATVRILSLDWCLPFTEDFFKEAQKGALREWLSECSLFLVPDLRTEVNKKNADQSIIYRYKRVSNYTQMNTYFETIQKTLLNIPGVEVEITQEMVTTVLRTLMETFSMTPEQAYEVYTDWVTKYGITFGVAHQRLQRQYGVIVRVHPNRILIRGSKDFTTGYRIYQTMVRIVSAFLSSKEWPKTAEGKLFLDAVKRNRSANNNQSANESNQVTVNTAYSVINKKNTKSLLSQFYVNRQNELMINMNENANYGNIQVNSSLLDEFLQANMSNVVNEEEQVSGNEHVPASRKVPYGYLADPSVAGKDDKLENYCTGEDADVEHDTCNNICDDPKYRLRRLKRYDAPLFVFEKSKARKSHSYSQTCQGNSKPIVIKYNPDDQPDIDRTSYTYALKYGSSADRQNFYICPQVWCPVCEVPFAYDMIQERIKTVDTKMLGRCETALCPRCEKLGKPTFLQIIPTKEYEEVGKYPGFVEKSKHPTGRLCMPCCFKNRSDALAKPSSKMRQRTLQCIGEEDTTDMKGDQGRNYLYKADKFPLPEGRYGMLPELLEQFLQTHYVSQGTSYLKPGEQAFVRRGVTTTGGQPILEIFYYLWWRVEAETKPEYILQQLGSVQSKKDEDKLAPSLSFEKWWDKTVNELTPQQFVRLHRGTLYERFRSIDEHFLKKTDVNVVSESVKVAFERFRAFCVNPDGIIPMSFVWDWMSQPGVIHPKGLHIYILEGTNWVCPFGQDWNALYGNTSRMPVLLYGFSDVQIYEPIILVANEPGKTSRSSQLVTDPYLNAKVDRFQKLSQFLQDQCKYKQQIDWDAIRRNRLKNEQWIPSKRPVIPSVKMRIEQARVEKLSIMGQLVNTMQQVVGLVVDGGRGLGPVVLPTRLDVQDSTISAMYEHPRPNVEKLVGWYKKMSKNDETLEPIALGLSPSGDRISMLILKSDSLVAIEPIVINDKVVAKLGLPVSQIRWDPESNKAVWLQGESYDNRAFESQKQLFLEEAYERYRYEMSKVIQSSQDIRDKIVTIVSSGTNKIGDKREKMRMLLQPLQKGIVSSMEKRDGWTLDNYQQPNIRQPCSSLIIPPGNAPWSSGEKESACHQDPHCAYDKKGSKCQLWIPNLDENLPDTQASLFFRRFVGELLGNRWKMDEVLENRIANIRNRMQVQLRTGEVLLEGYGDELLRQLTQYYTKKNVNRKNWDKKTTFTTVTELQNSDRERYRISQKDAYRSILTFLTDDTIKLPSIIAKRIGRGVGEVRFPDQKGQFFQLWRASTEDLFQDQRNASRSPNQTPYYRWENPTSFKKPSTTASTSKLQLEMFNNITTWQTWYSEILEEITPSLIRSFRDTLQNQFPSRANEKHPWYDGLDNTAILLEQTNSLQGRLDVLRSIWSTCTGKPLASRIADIAWSTWNSVRNTLQASEYPMCLWDMFLMHYYVGCHMLVVERRQQMAMPRGWTWFRGHSLTAPIMTVLHDHHDYFGSFGVVLLNERLWLSIPDWRDTIGDEIIGDGWKDLAPSDKYIDITPWKLTRPLPWTQMQMEDWIRTVDGGKFMSGIPINSSKLKKKRGKTNGKKVSRKDK